MYETTSLQHFIIVVLPTMRDTWVRWRIYGGRNDIASFPGHYLTLLRHNLALIYLERPYLIIYSYCCTCTVLLYFWVHTRTSTIAAIYISLSFGINYKKSGRSEMAWE